MLPKWTCFAISFICLLSTHSGTAQGLTLLGPGGGYASGNTLHLSYSIGEPLVQYAQNNLLWLTEGFQQPGHIDLMVSTDQPDALSNIAVFPNPATSSITISGSDLSDCVAVKVYNLYGQFVLSTALQDAQQTIRIDALHTGMYILTLQCEVTQYRSTTIVKL